MSLFGLRGRKFLDALQHHPSFPSSRFRLPCPPYDNPVFWDQLYKNMEYDQVNEWGGVDLSSSSSSGGLLQFRYEKVPILSVNDDNGSENKDDGEIISTTSFADWMDITQLDTPEEAIQLYQQQREQNENQSDNNHNDTNNDNEAILILGCGNSKLGEQLLINSFIGPILQLDISSKVIQLMTQRYHKYLSSDDSVVKRMEFMVDDASTGLTSLEPESVGGGVIDKGLVDVLHCSAGPIIKRDDGHDGNNDDDMIQRIMSSVHNVLQPSRPFIFFSRSEPQWMLRRVFGHDGYDDYLISGCVNGSSGSRRRSKKLWKDVEVVKLVDYDLLLYKLVKAEKEDYTDQEDDDEEEMGTKNSVIERKSYLKRLKGGSKKSKR